MSTSPLVTSAAPKPLDPRVIQEVLLGGDLSKLSPEQRISYYNRVCESLGLNPLTQPFAYIRLNGKEVLYAKKDAAEQLRFIHSISINPAGFTREVIEGVYIVQAPAALPSGRTDVSTGAVPIDGLKGENRANAMMKAETKAKRRVTLSICGLGMLDETEVESIQPPRLVTEATARVTLPAGTVQILKVVPRNVKNVEWADVTFVNDQGEEATYPLEADPRGAGAALYEQLAQEQCPVVLTTRVTPRSKKTAIDTVKRWENPEAVKAAYQASLSQSGTVDHAALDAEIAGKDAELGFAWLLPLVLPLTGMGMMLV